MEKLTLDLKLAVANRLPVRPMLVLLCDPSYLPLKNTIEGRRKPIVAIRKVLGYMRPEESIDECTDKLFASENAYDPLEVWRFHLDVESWKSVFQASNVSKVTSRFLALLLEIIDSGRNGRDLEKIYYRILRVTEENEKVSMTMARLEKEGVSTEGHKKLSKYIVDTSVVNELIGISMNELYSFSKMDLEAQRDLVTMSCKINESPVIFEESIEKRRIGDGDIGSKTGGAKKRCRDGQPKISPWWADESETLCGACGANYSNSDRLWVKCNICWNLFRLHGNCDKVTAAKAGGVRRFKCPSCVKKEAGGTCP